MKKIKDSFAGVLVGIVLLIVGTCLLWWNEGNNVRNIATTNEVEKTAIEVSSDKIDSGNEGKLVVVSDKLNVIDEKVTDTEFNISTKTANLQRKVEVYQWVQKEETDDDGNTTYSYEKEWSEDLIDSSEFKKGGHENPSSMPYSSEGFYAKEVKLGAFELSTKQIERLSADKTYNAKDVETKEGYTYQADYLTNSKDLANPEIGNIRISWTYNDWTETTVLAVQKANSFAAFTSKKGKTVDRIEKGTLTLQQLVEKMRKENKFMKWLLRAAGALCIIIGYISILGPISTLASFVPILGGIVGGLLGLLGLLIGLVHSLIIIVIAWFRFRPVLSIVLLVAIAVLIFGIVKLIKNKKNSEAIKAPDAA
jgi:hypothetical protein